MSSSDSCKGSCDAVECALTKSALQDRDIESLYEHMVALTGKVDSLASNQAQMIKGIQHLGTEFLELRQAITPGNNVERVVIMMGGSMLGGILVSVAFQLFAYKVAPLLSLLTP